MKRRDGRKRKAKKKGGRKEKGKRKATIGEK